MPTSIDRRRATDELWHMTKGDPLLLSLYAGALARGEVSFKRLSQIAPGLQGYFEEWWRDQRRAGAGATLDKPSVTMTLCALATSLGPIGLRDLAAVLAPKPSAGKIEKALEALRRFVIRAGGTEQVAYAFSHPKLQYFFRDRYVSSEKSWHIRYANHGATLFDDLKRSGVVPSDFSPYFLQHHGQHLELAGRLLEELAALLDKPWLEAWRASEHTEWGFLQDVERVQRLAVKADREAAALSLRAPHLHTEVACLLIRASLVSLNLSTPPELLGALLDKGAWDTNRALIDARRAPLPLSRALALAVIAQRLDPASARPLLEEAEALGSQLEVDGRTEAYQQMMCAAWLAVGDVERAHETQRHVADQKWRRDFLTVHAEQFLGALDAARLIATTDGLDPQHAFDVLLALLPRAQGLLRDTLFAEARKRAGRLFDDEKAVALLRLSSVEAPQKAQLVADALTVAEDVATWGMASQLCAKILGTLPASLTDAEIGRAAAVVEAVAANGSDTGVVQAALVRFLPAEDQRNARRGVLARLLEEGSLYASEAQDLFWLGGRCGGIRGRQPSRKVSEGRGRCSRRAGPGGPPLAGDLCRRPARVAPDGPPKERSERLLVGEDRPLHPGGTVGGSPRRTDRDRCARRPFAD